MIKKMETPFLDEMIEDLRNHIEHVEAISYSGIPETRKQLKELEAIKAKLKNNGDLGDVVEQSEQLLAFKEWERDKCRLPWDAEPKEIVVQYLSQ